MGPIRSVKVSTVASCVVAILGLGACATTVVDSTDSSTSSSAPVTVATTTVPTGTTEILAALHDNVGQLSEIVVETGGERAFAQLTQIESLWERVRPAVKADHPNLVEDFERMMALCRLAVERRRPAEADKAYAFMTPLIAALSNDS